MSFKSFPPIFDEQCRLLILGSFPSVKSREVSFYYGNKQNRFWGVLEEALGLDKFAAPSDKAAFLLERHIALWDVVCECEIKGSSDSSRVSQTQRSGQADKRRQHKNNPLQRHDGL